MFDYLVEIIKTSVISVYDQHKKQPQYANELIIKTSLTSCYHRSRLFASHKFFNVNWKFIKGQDTVKFKSE